jgi:hypothetical protein
MKKLIEAWKLQDLILPRWMLSAKYGFFVTLGILAAIAGIPTFDLTTFFGYTSIWSTGIVLSASLAFYASLSVARERHLEKWSAVALVALFGSYTVAAWIATLAEFGSDKALGRVIFCWILMGVTMLPSVRAWDLLRRYGLNRAN